MVSTKTSPTWFQGNIAVLFYYINFVKKLHKFHVLQCIHFNSNSKLRVLFRYFVNLQLSCNCHCIWQVEYETLILLSYRLEMYEVITQHLRISFINFLFVYSFKLEIGNNTILIFCNHLILTARRLKPSKLNVC